MFNSVSKSWRIKGNDSYKLFQLSNNFQDQYKYLLCSINSYYLSIAQCEKSDIDELTSSLKNYAMANWKIADICSILKKEKNLIEFYYKDSIAHFSKAKAYSQGIKSDLWIKQLNDSFQECVSNLFVFLEDYDNAAKCNSLEKILSTLIEESQNINILFQLSKSYMELGIANITEKNFRNALSYYHMSNQHLEMCRKMAVELNHEILKTETDVLITQNVYNLEIAESLQAIYLGDSSLEEALLKRTDFRDHYVYVAMDWYKKACINCSLLDLEIEAWALSKVGFIYADILKMKSKAKEYLHLSLKIANNSGHKGVATNDWYKKILRILQEYQKDVIDPDIISLEKKNILKELIPELNKLNQANVGTGAKNLLLHIYEHHPPKDERHNLDGKDLSDDTKVTIVLRQAIIHYHPDSQMKFNNPKWTVLCEEITKLLNEHFNKTKEDKS